MEQFIYPKLPGVKTTPLFRIGGNGLANCLFVYAKAIIAAHQTNAKIITPTWFNLSLGTYRRGQSDKRHYLGLFNHKGEICNPKKLFLLLTKRKTNNKDIFFKHDIPILIIEGYFDFFKPLLEHHELVRNYILDHVNKKLLLKVEEFNFSNTVAVHVRLGDFPPSRRIPMEWYVEKIRNFGSGKRFLIFSDGSDEELSSILEIPNTQRVFFGGAIQDIIAISRCGYLIGSDSSFSAWGAYLGQIPCIFYRLEFGRLLQDQSKQLIEATD